MLRVFKYLGLGLVGLILVAVLGLTALWFSATRDTAMREGTAPLPGLAGAVEVLRDGRGVPHIFAADRRDAMRALGYVHAQDRLWQMEMQRRIGAGRLAEIVGAPGLGFDRFTRALRLHERAASEYALLDSGLKADLDAYVEGVNSYLTAPDAALPPEYALLFLEPEPWTAADSLVWGKLMALQLSGNWYREVLEAALRQALPADQVEALFPDGPANAPVSIAEGPGADRVAPEADFAEILDALPEALVQDSASNAWVAGAGRVSGGGAILANDPHLGFTSPNLWYLARIVTPGETLVGATVPGVPLIVIGRNDRLAWGFTTTHADTQDLVVETIDPEDPGRYLTPDGPRPFGAREERFVVRLGHDVVDTLRETRHGPVLSDIVPDRFSPLLPPMSQDGEPPSKVVALADAALWGPDGTASALWRLNRAGSVAEGIAALDGFVAPIQNVHLADSDGHIGMIAPGRIPVRAEGHDGLTPFDGATTRVIWTDFIPFEALPRAVDPPSGQILNANNRLVGPDYPYLITARWPEGFRQLRLAELMDAAPTVTREASTEWQMDDLAADARMLLPLMLDIETGDPRAQAALDLLAAWDHRMRADRAEPLIWQAWSRALVRAIAADELGGLFDRYWRDQPLFLLRVLREDPSWCDRRDTEAMESCAFILEAALADALTELTEAHGEEMADWRWGAVHVAAFEHRPLGFLPMLGGRFGASIDTHGGDHTLNRGQTPGGDSSAPYRHRHGAGLRVVIDMGDPDASLFQMAMGQNGNPFGPNFDDWMTDWRDGRYVTLAGSAEELRAAGAKVLSLTP